MSPVTNWPAPFSKTACAERLASVVIHKEVQAMSKDAAGMRGQRSRNQDGQLRDKRDDTYMRTIEQQYNRDFGVRGDMHLGNFLEANGVASLNDLIHSKLGRKE